jgi:hypothetical protein
MPPFFIARVHYYPTEAGGRRGPTPAAGRIGCVLIVDDESFEGVINLDGVGPIRPGSTARVAIELLRPDLAKDNLVVGKHFLLREADVVGEGEIEEIQASPPDE